MKCDICGKKVNITADLSKGEGEVEKACETCFLEHVKREGLYNVMVREAIKEKVRNNDKMVINVS